MNNDIESYFLINESVALNARRAGQTKLLFQFQIG